MTQDMVYFLLPNGDKVSNDPRFGLEEALQEQLDKTPNTGDVGIPHDEMLAQHQAQHLADINSGQPGVGDNATVEDATAAKYGPLGSPAQQRQVMDRERAEELGGSPDETAVPDPEPVDSNEEVLKVREAREEARRKAQKAQEALGEEGAGDTDKPYSEWNQKQLKAEVAKRNAAKVEAGEEPLELKKGMKIADVAEMLDADDEASASGSTAD